MMLVVTKCQNDMSIYRLSIVGRGLVSVSYKICNYTKQGTRSITERDSPDQQSDFSDS